MSTGTSQGTSASPSAVGDNIGAIVFIGMSTGTSQGTSASPSAAVTTIVGGTYMPLAHK